MFSLYRRNNLWPISSMPRPYLPVKAASNVFSPMGSSPLRSSPNRNIGPFSAQINIILSEIQGKGYGEFPHFQEGKSYQESKVSSFRPFLRLSTRLGAKKVNLCTKWQQNCRGNQAKPVMVAHLAGSHHDKGMTASTISFFGSGSPDQKFEMLSAPKANLSGKQIRVSIYCLFGVRHKDGAALPCALYASS